MTAVLQPGQRGISREEQRLRLVLKAGGFGTWVWDAASSVTIWDAQLEAVFGLPPGGFEGTYEGWMSRLHPDDRDHVVATVQQAVLDHSTYDIKHRVVWPDGSVHWVEGLGQVTEDETGAATGTIGCTRDITNQMLVEQRLAEAAHAASVAAARASLLHAITAALGETMSAHDVAATLASRAEGLLGATAVAVALLTADGESLTVVNAFGFDPGKVSAFARVALSASTPMTECVRTGQPVLANTEYVRARYGELATLTAGTGHTLLAALPLQLPDRSLGALLLAFSGPDDLSEDDVEFMSAVAGQCSQALERARLVERLADVAVTLQDGLAPPGLPDLPGYELAGVYRPGGDETEHLGGDWYDVTTAVGGVVVLGVGDVMGRGVASATTMSRIRTAVRAYAWLDPDPTAVLGRLDAFVRREAPDDFVTMIYAVLDAGSGRIAMVNAGHLPPVHITGDGMCTLVVAATQLPLGLTGEPRPAHVVTLEPGDALLTFTDGLVERRDQDIDASLSDLLDVVAQSPPRARVGQIIERLVRQMTSRVGPGDDVTALIVRRTANDVADHAATAAGAGEP